MRDGVVHRLATPKCRYILNSIAWRSGLSGFKNEPANRGNCTHFNTHAAFLRLGPRLCIRLCPAVRSTANAQQNARNRTLCRCRCRGGRYRQECACTAEGTTAKGRRLGERGTPGKDPPDQKGMTTQPPRKRSEMGIPRALGKTLWHEEQTDHTGAPKHGAWISSTKAGAEYVFTNQDGAPFKTVQNIFRSACKRAGLLGLSPHVCRHTFGSRLAMARADLRTIAGQPCPWSRGMRT